MVVTLGTCLNPKHQPQTLTHSKALMYNLSPNPNLVDGKKKDRSCMYHTHNFAMLSPKLLVDLKYDCLL